MKMFIVGAGPWGQAASAPNPGAWRATDELAGRAGSLTAGRRLLAVNMNSQEAP